MDSRFRMINGDAVLTFDVIGAHDIFRFAINMLDDQVEFCAEGTEILASLRRQMTAKRFDPWAKSLLGDERYERLAPYFRASRS